MGMGWMGWNGWNEDIFPYSSPARNEMCAWVFKNSLHACTLYFF